MEREKSYRIAIGVMNISSEYIGSKLELLTHPDLTDHDNKIDDLFCSSIFSDVVASIFLEISLEGSRKGYIH